MKKLRNLTMNKLWLFLKIWFLVVAVLLLSIVLVVFIIKLCDYVLFPLIIFSLNYITSNPSIINFIVVLLGSSFIISLPYWIIDLTSEPIENDEKDSE